MRRLAVIGVLLLVATGCSEPPSKEIDQAQAAVDVARTAGADRYAADDYNAAAAGVQKARAAVDQRDYRQALSYAIDARQRAQDALKQAAAGKAQAQQTTQRVFTDVTARADQLDARLRTAEAAHAAMKELRTSREAVADIRKGLQEARTEIGAGHYARADDILAQVRKHLDAAARDMENIPQRPQRSPRTSKTSTRR